ncbi:MAG: VWA domain-containing protein [Thermoanaerobaculia bacterium]|nr:VWA domain-containing protein [Thermoanaerobaculia bacterium]
MKRRWWQWVGVLLITLGGAPLGADGGPSESQSPPTDPPPTESPSPESIPPGAAALSAVHRAWLGEVKLLLGEEERAAFLALRRDYQREAFIERFWEARDPYPATARNELYERWEANAEVAEAFDPDDARAPLVRLFGPPDARFEGRCSGLLDPLEVWSYQGNYLVGSGFTLVFVQPGGDRGGIYQLWDPVRGLDSLFVFSAPTDVRLAAVAISEGCLRGSELADHLLGAHRWSEIEKRLAKVLHPNAEWVSSFSARSTDLPENAGALPAQLAISFPSRHQSRTVVQGLVTVPKAAAVTGDAGERPTFAFLVDGEVLRQGQLFDHFRYRFDLPADVLEGDSIPVLVERYLRPGSYDLIVKVEDLNGGTFFRQERDLVVPVVRPGNRGPEVRSIASSTGFSDALAPASDSEMGDEVDDEVLVTLGPVPKDLTTGLVRVHAVVKGSAVARVRFELDDKPVLSKKNPPFEVELDLGRAPLVHTVRAVALDAQGEALASDETALNAGPHRFAVRLVEPRANRPAGTPLRARAVVEVPDGERLDRLEIFMDETLLATLYQAPFVQPLNAVSDRDVSYVRAVAYLAEGGTAEDIAFLHAPGEVDEVDVQLVELYTTVVDRRGRPIEGLAQSDFEILEEGESQQILRFEWMDDLPIHAGILLDTSTSMLPVIDDAEQAALGFFEKLLTPRDRASVITFNDQPKLEVRFTSKIERLAGGLANLVVEGDTALYDSLIYALYYFSGVQGKRMLVVISDGEDSASRYAFEEVLDFARHAGVSIYPIGLNLPSNNEMARMALQRLAYETGGRYFFIESARELQGVYNKIERELRSQYLLAYQSNLGDTDPDHYREIEVNVDKPGHSARTLRGYYP